MKYKSVDKDILVVVTITLIAAILAFVVPSNIVPIRILALPLVLVLPGYALTSAIFLQHAPGIAERLLFSLGLSLVVVILGGLVLNWTPSGLRASSWIVLLTIITLTACIIALKRRRGQNITGSSSSGIGHVSFTFRQGLLLSLAALIACGAVALSIVGASQQPRPGFTQLWILPASGVTNAKNTVHLGMNSMELTSMQYRLAINVDGKVVKQWPSIDLQPGKKWEATLVLPQTGHTGTRRVEATLYLTDAPTTIYRDVVLWLGT